MARDNFFFLKDTQKELYGKQRKVKILTKERLESLCDSVDHANFVAFSDNTLESIHVFELITKYSEHLSLVGIVYQPINQPIYCFTSEDEKVVNVKICGGYSSWSIPKSVEDIISFADIPDIVISKFNKRFCPAIVVETTGTANVGNSQWQREGRKIGAAKAKVPFVYQTYYSGTDRSQPVDKGQPREPTSLQVLNHIVYSIRYKCPSFVIYLDNPDVDERLGLSRSAIEGRSLIGNYISLVLLNSAFSSYEEGKKSLERAILKHMRSYLCDTIIRYGKHILRLDNDLPILSNKQRKLLLEGDSSLDNFIISRIYDKTTTIEPMFDILDWDFARFSRWTPGNLKEKPLIQDVLQAGIPILSYKKGISKVGICLDTPRLKEIIASKYNPHRVSVTSLESSLPTLIFPGRVWKGAKKIESGDPESGELYAFTELFALDLEGKKKMNVLLYIVTEPPAEFDFCSFISKNTKLTRSFRYNADLIMVDDKVQSFDDD